MLTHLFFKTKTFTHHQNILVSLAIVFLIACPPAKAKDLVPSQLEYMGASPFCKEAFEALNRNKGLNIPYIPRWGANDAYKDLVWKTGGWHYCQGKLKINHAKNEPNEYLRKQLYEDGIGNAKYTYNRIDKTNPWAAEIAATMAQGYLGLGKRDIAITILDEALKQHPDNSRLLIEYGMLYYYEENYKDALSYFKKANHADDGRSSMTAYFIGLAYYRLGDIENAQIYSNKARDLGYPLDGLQKLIDGKASLND